MIKFIRRRSTGIMPSEADLDTPDKVSEMGGLLGITTPDSRAPALLMSPPNGTSRSSDPLSKLALPGASLLVPEAHVYKLPAKKSVSAPARQDRLTKLSKVCTYHDVTRVVTS